MWTPICEIFDFNHLNTNIVYCSEYRFRWLPCETNYNNNSSSSPAASDLLCGTWDRGTSVEHGERGREEEGEQRGGLVIGMVKCSEEVQQMPGGGGGGGGGEKD